jgi:Acetoacetate decarboxylase (ADC)
MAPQDVTTLPRYVDYSGRVTAPGDFHCDDGHFRCLLLEADKSKLQEQVDKIFNGPANGELQFRVLTKFVLMQFGWFGAVSSMETPFDEMGKVREEQVSIWVPLAQGHEDERGRFVAEELVLAVPFIFVDNPMSAAGGRETYGYPKSLGKFHIDEAKGVHGTMSVDTFGGAFGKDNQAEWREIIEVSLRDESHEESVVQLNSKEEFISHLTQGELEREEETIRPGDIAILRDAARKVLGGRSTQVFLKQFRDAEDALGACYQKIVQADIEMGETSGTFSKDVWHVEIADFASHPIVGDLGLKSQDTFLTYAVDMEFVCKRGKVVS